MAVPKLLLTVGLMAANMALTMTRKIEGPRLESTKVTEGDYGAQLPYVWGKRRLPGSIIWAENLREVKQRRKTKGGKFNEYTYFGTWAVAVAGHEVDAISRIWFDTHLIYDLTGAGPVTPFDFGSNSMPRSPLGSSTDSYSVSDHITIYLGTATQEADPRMQATVEAEFGEGSCPAYRGIAYIVFKDIPLEKLGNRIPQVSVEVIRDPVGAYPYEQIAITGGEFSKIQFSPDYSTLFRAAATGGDGFSLVDVAARTEILTGTPDRDVWSSFYWGYSPATASYVAIDNGLDRVWRIDIETGQSTALSDPLSFGEYQNSAQILIDGDGVEHWASFGAQDLYLFDGVEYDTSAAGWGPECFFVDGYGAVWMAGNGTTTLYIRRILNVGDGPSTEDYVEVTGLPASPGKIAVRHVLDSVNDHFIVAWGDHGLYTIDRATSTVIDSNTSLTADDMGGRDRAFANWPQGSPSIWMLYKEISVTDLSVIRTVSKNSWLSGTGIATLDVTVYDPINHALITRNTGGNRLIWLYLDRVDSAGTTLGEICTEVAELVGAAEYDFTALDQLVQGWSATQGQGSAMIEPLLDAYDSDIAVKDFGIIGVKRGGTASTTLLTERFVSDGGPRYSVRVRQAAELPRQLVYNFADVDAEQQPNSVPSVRNREATAAADERTIELSTFACDTETMRGLADRHFRRMWGERREASLALTMQQLAIAPTDLRILDLDGDTWPARCIKTTIKAGGAIATEWKYDHPSLALTSGAPGSGFDGREPAVVAVPLISKGFVLDVPLLADADSSSNPLVYLAAGPYAAGAWPGATVYQEVDGDYSDETGTLPSTAQATWGLATDVLADANPWLWDRGGSVNISLKTGSLTGTTEAACDANPLLNMALLGNEIIQFTTATLEGDGTYTLSGLKRGRRGTEWACDTHAAGDRFVLLDTADAAPLGLSEVGTNLSFKAVTTGRTEAGAFAINLAPFTGASLKPYAPCHLEAVKDAGTGDWTLTWVRRTRVGGAWTSGTSIPLSEASEAYEVDIMNGSTVVRTITAATATATWTAAQQTTDFGSGQSSISYRVYQISDAVDRGFVAAATA